MTWWSRTEAFVDIKDSCYAILLVRQKRNRSSIFWWGAGESVVTVVILWAVDGLLVALFTTRAISVPIFVSRACDVVASVILAVLPLPSTRKGLWLWRGLRLLNWLQDAHVALVPIEGNDQVAWFAVFDGHGGSLMSQERYELHALNPMPRTARGDQRQLCRLGL